MGLEGGWRCGESRRVEDDEHLKRAPGHTHSTQAHRRTRTSGKQALTVDDGVDRGHLLQRGGGCLDKRAHEPQLAAVGLQECVLRCVGLSACLVTV